MKQYLKLGFTLTELMAVVIIVAILAGIGLGSYRKSVEQSHFSEGLAAGAAVQEAVNRINDEKRLAMSNQALVGVDDLDINISNASACTANTANSQCLKTKYFEIVITAAGVYAYRVKGSQKKDYYLYFTPRGKETCTGTTDAGKSLCKAMGYR